MSEEKPCRHEYVRIFQRRLKGLERRLDLTRGYLPTGFKTADFSHLGENSFCFCAKCRARLFPRRTQAEKNAVRVALVRAKLEEEQILRAESDAMATDLNDADDLFADSGTDSESSQTVSVEELELTAVDVEDIEADGVKLPESDDSPEISDEDQ